MARPKTVSNETILSAAREVFLEHGIRGTTAQIAAIAGCSEGSIFNRFGTKAELFEASLHMGEVTPQWLSLLLTHEHAECPREVLVRAGIGMSRFFWRVMPLSMMTWSNPLETHARAGSPGWEPPPVRGQRLMRGFFTRAQEAGHLRDDADPEIIARAYSGAIVQRVIYGLMFEPREEPPPAEEEAFIRALVDTLWHGIARTP